jgi:hypothetical protein
MDDLGKSAVALMEWLGAGATSAEADAGSASADAGSAEADAAAADAEPAPCTEAEKVLAAIQSVDVQLADLIAEQARRGRAASPDEDSEVCLLTLAEIVPVFSVAECALLLGS